MKLSDTTMEIKTLGRFSIFVDGKPVAIEWPDEAKKELFCSLLSPLDLYFTWDRVCRCILGIPDTLSGRRKLEATAIRPLNSFLLKEFNINPIIMGHDGIRIDQQRIHVDAFKFHSIALEGLHLLSLDEHAAAFEKFCRAKLLYAGRYLPGMSGNIIENTRKDLESFYQSVVMQTNRDMIDLLAGNYLPVI